MKISKSHSNQSVSSKVAKVALVFASIFSPIFISPQPSYATRSLDKCKNLSLPASITTSHQINSSSGCTITPTSFKVKGYEIGLCTANNNPFSTSGLDTSGCAKIWIDESGVEANLVSADGSAAIFTLDESNAIKPSNGTYKYAYIIFDDTVNMSASLELDDETWVTTSDNYEYIQDNREEGFQASLGNTTGTPEIVPTRIGYFDEASGGACYIENFEVDNITLSAMVLNSDKSTLSTLTAAQNNYGESGYGYCAGSTYIGAVQTLQTPVTITDDTSSANLSFTTTDTGVYVESYTYSGVPKIYFGMGPFIVNLTVN